MHSSSIILNYIFALLIIFLSLNNRNTCFIMRKMPAMVAFMDQSFSSTVLEGASRQKNKHDGLEEQPQTISCPS